MRCRRGGSSGQVNSQPSSSISESSSYSSDFGPVRYPAFRRGRGRGRGQPNSAAHFRLSSRTQSHISHLQYPCTLSNFTFLATVTIELREVSFGLVMETPGVALETREEDTHDTSQNDNRQSVEPGGIATQDVSLQAGPSVPTGGGTASKESPPLEEEDPYQYACRIIEEVSSPSHEA